MFDQREFVDGLQKPQLDTVGYYFVPSSCERRKCLLHVYFHGCMTGRWAHVQVLIDSEQIGT